MKKTKNIILPLTACMLLFTLTGCQSKTDAPEINTYHETIDPPADGWTDADIEKVLYINGKQISFPFTLDELGEGFTWDLENANYYQNTDKKSYVPILYSGKRFALAFMYAKDSDELDNAEIVGVSYNSYPSNEDGSDMPNLIFFNGITLKSNFEEAQKAFGENSFSEYSNLFCITDKSYTIRCISDEEYGVESILIENQEFK